MDAIVVAILQGANPGGSARFTETARPIASRECARELKVDAFFVAPA
jgi:hypothetical protein